MILEFVRELAKYENMLDEENWDKTHKLAGKLWIIGDIERGIAILPKSKQQDTIKQVFSEIEG